jgi:hypothetical protein
MPVNCDICGQPACLHITEIKGGITTATGLCEEHARTIAGIPPGTMLPLDELTRGGSEYIEFFLWLREEFQLTGTIPPAEEILATGKTPATSVAILENPATQDAFWTRLKDMAANSGIDHAGT